MSVGMGGSVVREPLEEEAEAEGPPLESEGPGAGAGVGLPLGFAAGFEFDGGGVNVGSLGPEVPSVAVLASLPSVELPPFAVLDDPPSVELLSPSSPSPLPPLPPPPSPTSTPASLQAPFILLTAVFWSSSSHDFFTQFAALPSMFPVVQ